MLKASLFMQRATHKLSGIVIAGLFACFTFRHIQRIVDLIGAPLRREGAEIE